MAKSKLKQNTGVTVTAGMQFRWTVADHNALWEVKKLRGRGVWECEVVNEPYTYDGKTYEGEHAGLRRPFDENDIGRAVAMAKLFDNLGNENERFYASLKRGQVVHYDSGFGQFVRCEVTVQEGKTVLKPLALVGAWRQFDLYRRDRTGKVHLGTYPEMIETGRTMTPNNSCIYESTRRGSDPTKLPAIDYRAPEMTDAEKAVAKNWSVLEGLRDMLTEAKDPVETLKLAKSWLAAWEPGK